MEVTSVRIDRVMAQSGQIIAFCTLALDDQFIIRGVRLVHRGDGLPPIVAMPSDPLRLRCRACAARNRDDARYCSRCGTRAPGLPPAPYPDGTLPRRHTSVCHPADQETRLRIEAAVLAAYAEYSAVPTGAIA